MTTAPHSVAQRCIDWPAAQAIASAACACAQAQGLRINVAVVDASGVLMAFLRMPGAFLHSIDIAIDKAYTAAGFGVPTGAWTEALASHSPAVRDGLPRRPRFVAFGGGLPIVEDGVLIGAIGVSGGSESQDEACAQAGLGAIGLSV
ncbi:MAG: heme-binding protein [Burkholderiaceae bacterium]|nr:MAG: heme-binding protein [Burkholderiaceae bacterium]